MPSWYLAQLDRARIWAAGGNLDEALTSLPAARAALKSDHSALLVLADELEAHIRLGLGDQEGASTATEQLPGGRRTVMAAIIALAAGNPDEAAQALSGAPAEGATIRSDLELRLLRASVALSQDLKVGLAACLKADPVLFAAPTAPWSPETKEGSGRS